MAWKHSSELGPGEPLTASRDWMVDGCMVEMLENYQPGGGGEGLVVLYILISWTERGA